MMSLDSITLYLVATMVAALLGAMMVFFGRQENSPRAEMVGHRLSARRGLGRAVDARPATSSARISISR